MNFIQNTNKINCLDNGYIRIANSSGTEIDVVNAARVSFDKESRLDEFGKIKTKDEKLIAFLLREKHLSPFRHVHITFEIYAPLMVCRQWWKYVIGSSHLEEGSAHNESSRRYITEEPIFYIPANTNWRAAPSDKKQGSGVQLSPQIGTWATNNLLEYIDKGLELYQQALDFGVCAEQARLFLPAYGMYVRWRWTTSLATVMHFLEERLAHDAQAEIRQYAAAVLELTTPLFPATFKLLNLGE